MAATTSRFDRLRVTDERLVELTLGVAIALVAIAAVSWAVDALYESDALARTLYTLGAVIGAGLIVAIYHRHVVGLVGGVLFFVSVVGDVLIAWSGFQAPLGLTGAIGFALVGSGALLLCRHAFLESPDG